MTWVESLFRRDAIIEEITLKRISRRQMGRRLDGFVGSLFGLGMKMTFLLRRVGERRPLFAAMLANLRRRGLMMGYRCLISS